MEGPCGDGPPEDDRFLLELHDAALVLLSLAATNLALFGDGLALLPLEALHLIPMSHLRASVPTRHPLHLASFQ